MQTEQQLRVDLAAAFRLIYEMDMHESVANHLNDIAKTNPELVIATLQKWQGAGRQSDAELKWMTRHALRTLVKRGDPQALDLLGYHADAPVVLDRFDLTATEVRLGDTLEFEIVLAAQAPCPVLVDYVIIFPRPSGRSTAKVFKLTQTHITPEQPVTLRKRHRLKADATTFALVPGQHRIDVQVNGKLLGGANFMLTPP